MLEPDIGKPAQPKRVAYGLETLDQRVDTGPPDRQAAFRDMADECDRVAARRHRKRQEARHASSDRCSEIGLINRVTIAAIGQRVGLHHLRGDVLRAGLRGRPGIRGPLPGEPVQDRTFGRAGVEFTRQVPDRGKRDPEPAGLARHS